MSQILPWLYLGSYYDASDEQWLKKHNITGIINIAAELNFMDYPSFILPENILRLPAQDSSKFNIEPYFDMCYLFISISKLEKRNVLIHCMAGISRSTTVAVYYIAKINRWTSSATLDYIKKRRPQAKPNHGFIKQLQSKDMNLVTEN